MSLMKVLFVFLLLGSLLKYVVIERLETGVEFNIVFQKINISFELWNLHININSVCAYEKTKTIFRIGIFFVNQKGWLVYSEDFTELR